VPQTETSNRGSESSSLRMNDGLGGMTGMACEGILEALLYPCPVSAPSD
jgi:hypothetical protein